MLAQGVWYTLPQCLWGVQRWKVVAERESVWWDPVEKFNQQRALAMKSVVVTGPTLPGEEEVPSLENQAETKHQACGWVNIQPYDCICWLLSGLEPWVQNLWIRWYSYPLTTSSLEEGELLDKVWEPWDLPPWTASKQENQTASSSVLPNNVIYTASSPTQGSELLVKTLNI
jgi:hypothetical protein